MNIIICENCQEINEYGAKVCKKCGHQLYYREGIEIVSEDEMKVEENSNYNNESNGILINLSVEEAENLIEKSNLGMSFTIRGKRKINFNENKKCTIIIAEKYFYMVKSYISATIIIDNVENNTRVQICVSGAGETLIGFEYGREEKFYKQIEEIFKDYRIV